jgi:hypothetical protein
VRNVCALKRGRATRDVPPRIIDRGLSAPAAGWPFCANMTSPASNRSNRILQKSSAAARAKTKKPLEPGCTDVGWLFRFWQFRQECYCTALLAFRPQVVYASARVRMSDLTPTPLRFSYQGGFFHSSDGIRLGYEQHTNSIRTAYEQDTESLTPRSHPAGAAATATAEAVSEWQT